MISGPVRFSIVRIVCRRHRPSRWPQTHRHVENLLHGTGVRLEVDELSYHRLYLLRRHVAASATGIAQHFAALALESTFEIVLAASAIVSIANAQNFPHAEVDLKIARKGINYAPRDSSLRKRVIPTIEQAQILAKSFGAVEFVQ